MHNEQSLRAGFVKAVKAGTPYGVPFGRGFDAFVESCYLSFRQVVNRLTAGCLDSEIEERYERIMEEFKRDKFAEALAWLTELMEVRLHDALGTVFMAEGLGDKRSGQFFTPYELSLMTVRMNLESLDTKERVTVYDPCCGAGAFGIAAAQVMQDKGVGAAGWWMRNTDIDRRCFQMAYVQLTLAGVPGVLEHGNSISGEVYDRAVTLVGALHPYREKPAEPTYEVSDTGVRVRRRRKA